jgi:hypothetical protein
MWEAALLTLTTHTGQSGHNQSTVDMAAVESFFGPYSGGPNTLSHMAAVSTHLSGGAPVGAAALLDEPREYVALTNARGGKKPIGGLGVRPVLTGIADALAHGITDLLQNLSASSTKTGIFESGFVYLAFGPVRRRP